MPFSGTQDQTDGRFFIRLSLITIQPAEIKFHLPFMAGLELAEFQLDSHQTTQLPEIEQQVKIVIDPINSNSFLPFQKCETNPQLQYERLHLTQDRGFHIFFSVSVFKPQK